MHERKMANEWKEFMSFPKEWSDIPSDDHDSEECSKKGSNEDVDQVQDLPIQKVQKECCHSDDMMSREEHARHPFDIQ